MTRRATLMEYGHKLILKPTTPFNFEGTVHKPSHFPSPDNSFKDGIYRFSLIYQNKTYGVRLTNAGTLKQPKVELNIFSSRQLKDSTLESIRTEIEYRFDLQSDLNEFYKTCKHDSVLSPVLRRWRGSRVSNGNSLYEFLVITTVLQNATVRRSVQMIENLFSYFGRKIKFDGETFSTFWSPHELNKASEADLRALKLGYRAKTFLEQARSFSADEFDEGHLRLLPTPELKLKLLQLYGVGPASVWYLLFEVFKRYDAFEYISPWEQKIYSRILFSREIVSAKTILKEVNHRWGKWKMLASHLLFEDLFWRRKTQQIPWLQELIRL